MKVQKRIIQNNRTDGNLQGILSLNSKIFPDVLKDLFKFVFPDSNFRIPDHQPINYQLFPDQSG